MSSSEVPETSQLIERRVEPNGGTFELYQRGEAYDVVADGRHTWASDRRRSESSLVELGLAPLRDRDDISVLLAGLGMGFTLEALLQLPNVKRVDVVEASTALVDWEMRYFAGLNKDAARDPRVTIHTVELSLFLKQHRRGGELPSEGWLSLLLDVDEGPSAPRRPAHALFYGDEGLQTLESALRPGGVLALWSGQRETDLVRRLHARFQNVAEVAVPVELDGRASLDYIYRGRRQALPSTKPTN